MHWNDNANVWGGKEASGKSEIKPEKEKVSNKDGPVSSAPASFENAGVLLQ